MTAYVRKNGNAYRLIFCVVVKGRSQSDKQAGIKLYSINKAHSKSIQAIIACTNSE